jgi:hypothetical protein|uniref:Uncharacterized protein n=1 Tax=viral metagenome TaxID=1070528 RepID=A0A6C0BZE2_9ZZZZ
MRFYVDNFNLNTIHPIREYQKKTKEETILLSYDGLYKYDSNNDLYKYKARGNKSTSFNADKYKIIETNTFWKKYDISLKIPFVFKKMNIKIFDFYIDKDIIFRVEKINKQISDYYFISDYSIDDYFLKDGIISFLSLFNNINNI